MANPFASQPRVFIVDDELDIAKMLAVVLQMNQFDAVPFSDPLLVVEVARVEPPDYLISDIVMPGMNGIDLAIAVQGIALACKVLLFSGQVGAAELVSDAREAGHNFQLAQKPIHPTRMVEAIRNL